MRPPMRWCTILSVMVLGTLGLKADDGYELWLKYRLVPDPTYRKALLKRIPSVSVPGDDETQRVIRDELKRGLSGLLGRPIPIHETLSEKGLLVVLAHEAGGVCRHVPAGLLDTLGVEGFAIVPIPKAMLLTAHSPQGLLYGAYHLLRMIQLGEFFFDRSVVSKPRIQYRLLNHWDNLDGTVERGYAGRSLWKWEELPGRIDPRYRDYARANASIGINGTVLNNVNANPAILKHDYLEKVAALADVFRPYGIRVFLSINFSSPLRAPFSLEDRRKGGIGDLETSDPLDPAVRAWWRDKVEEIYRIIPDFGGFLVKANSEGMPGPQDYGRTHAEGANMLAEALAPHGGIVMWRAFVYDEAVDPDRAKRSYKEFVPLDGLFLPNVFVQAKNGPIDFQPREPVQPLFGAMPHTPLMLELQITQEYLGHATHLVYLAPMWREYLDFDLFAKGPGSTLARVIDGSLFGYPMTGIAGVSNIGDDRNWCGHFFAQANWYAFGRLAWDHTLPAERIAEEWIRMSLGGDPYVVNAIRDMMMGSWEACVQYMTPLGLHHIMQAGFHYGPQPDYADAPRLDWTSVYYHRADSMGIGFDRSSRGSDAVSQYVSPLREWFDNVETCPEKYLLWFHHLPWDFPLRSGQTLWEALCHHYHAGTAYVDQMALTWENMKGKVDPEIFDHVKRKLAQQKQDATIWRDTCLHYFQQFSRREIVH